MSLYDRYKRYMYTKYFSRDTKEFFVSTKNPVELVTNRSVNKKSRGEKMTKVLLDKYKNLGLLRKSSDKVTKYDIGCVRWVYNGREYQRLVINEMMCGFKFGDFIFTRKMSAAIHSVSRSKKRKK